MQVRRSPHQHFFASYGPSTSVWSVIFNDTGQQIHFTLSSGISLTLCELSFSFDFESEVYFASPVSIL